MKKLFILFVMVAGFATVTMAQVVGTSSNLGTTSTITTASTGAKILIPIILTWDGTKLEYGEVVIQDIAQIGSISLYPDAAGFPSTSSPVNCVSTGLNIPLLIPSFDVKGTQNTLYTITTPADGTTNIVHTLVPANVLPLTAFKIYRAAALSASNVIANATTDALGVDAWKVGATLNFIAGQASGLYTGVYTVIADYN